MKFVSKHPGYKHTIIEPTQSAEVGANGVTRYVLNPGAFTAEWVIRTLTDAEIKAAKDQILANGGRYAFGSVPSADDGNINVQDALQEGYSSTAHVGYDVYQQLSTFDTADPLQCPPELRELTEQTLLEHYELGQAYVRVDDYQLTPPWPTYPVSGDVNVTGVVEFAKAGGLVTAALQFEQAVGQRHNLVEALQQAADEELAAEQERIALSAKV